MTTRTRRPSVEFPKFLTIGSVSGLTLGFVVGAIAFDHPGAFFDSMAALTGPLGQAWVNALMMIVVPLIISFLVLATGEIGTKQSATLGSLSVGLFVAFMLGAAALTLMVGPPLMKWVPVDPGGISAALSAAGGETAGTTQLPSGLGFGEWVVALFPPNIVHAVAAGDILGIAVVSIIFGLAISRIGAGARRLLDLFAAVRDATLVVTTWILWTLPLAAFALAFGVGRTTGTAIAGAFGYWILISSALPIILLIVLYPVTAWLGGISIRRFARGVWPSQVVAASTRSSLASLPALLQSGEDRLKLPSDVVGLTLPLAVSTFKLNVVTSAPLKLIFLTTLLGIPLDPSYLLIFVALRILLSFSEPGVPSGGFSLMLPFYVAAGIPVEAVVMLQAIDAIPDIFKTTLNVTADMSVAVIVTRIVRWRMPVAEPAPA